MKKDNKDWKLEDNRQNIKVINWNLEAAKKVPLSLSLSLGVDDGVNKGMISKCACWRRETF